MSTDCCNVFLVAGRNSSRATPLAEEIASWLEARGVACTVVRHSPKAVRADFEAAGPVDLALVLGGDGTFVSVARQMLGTGVPMLGVNLGQVGFLTEVSPNDWQRPLEDVIQGRARIESRLALTYRVVQDNDTVHQGRAVNDLVIGRGSLARLVRLSLSYDGRRVTSLRSDGLIVSTPTGSTAYSVSAGGPFVHPRMQAYCLTPVCPYRNYFRSMMLPAGPPITVHNDERVSDIHLTEDGQDVLRIGPGGSVEIGCDPAGLRLARIEPDCYFETLRDRGFLTER